MNEKIKQGAEWTLDRFWPRIYGKTEKRRQPQVVPDVDYLDVVEKAVGNLMIQEEERAQTVDRKLLSLMTFGSVASSVIIAGTIGAATLDIPSNTWALKALAAVAVSLGAYIAVQLLNVVTNATIGLSARDYETPSAKSVVPLDQETEAAFRKRQIALKLSALNQNEWQTNRKVDKMKVAHEALKNSSCAAIVLAMAVGVAAMFTIWTAD